MIALWNASQVPTMTNAAIAIMMVAVMAKTRLAFSFDIIFVDLATTLLFAGIGLVAAAAILPAELH